MLKDWEVDFNKIVNDILKNEKFIDLKYEIHHGISRMNHSLHVARITYLWCRKMHLKNTEDITRAALLHDFFQKKDIKKNAFVNHPKVALENAKQEFDINPMQENIIASHMFPMTTTLPNCKESYIVSAVDKMVALYELTKYKAPIEVGALLIFAVNFLVIQR